MIFDRLFRKARRSVLDLSGIRRYDEDEEAFVLSKGYMDIFRIKMMNMQALSEEERDWQILRWQKFYLSFEGDLKIVSVVCPVDTMVQQDSLRVKLESTDDQVHREILEEKLAELRHISESTRERRCYLFFYPKDPDELRTDRIRIRELLSGSVMRMRTEEKLRLLRLLNNQSLYMKGGDM